MGSQTPTNNDRSRTYWTPSMERYFLDLMLEHMNKGNRVGHTFNKQAWADMLIVFNAKFGSQYDKDALKSRYTNLWKQFNDVRYLLAQSDFSWDETRQMVSADEFVWDAYIKIHPDARPYKTKPVLNFTDLCLIYEYVIADGRYSRSSHDMDIDDEIQGINNIGSDFGSLVSSSNECPKANWTPEMDQYLIDLMLIQLQKGNKIGNTFSKLAWTEMLSLFNSKFSPRRDRRTLKHKHKKLLKYYNDITSLLKQSGFSWDETQQTIAADDSIWDAYVKVHPQARLYRAKWLLNYRDLVLIYENDTSAESFNHLPERNDIKSAIICADTGEGKESQSSTCSRTYWTPPMDCYLIDLLIGQVEKGNKLGQTFISQAWVDMVASFNANFNAHYERDVLKNRYKHLKKRYDDIMFLLQQDGFSWNDDQGIVVAEDHVWDAYATVRPDAKSYRVKAVPNYQKLCVIFGKENANQRYLHLARNTDPNTYISNLPCGKEIGFDRVPSGGINISRIDWTPTMDRLLIDLVLEEFMREEHGTDHQNLSQHAWDRIVASFVTNFGHYYDRFVVEKQYMELMKEFNEIINILNHTGFSWDGCRQILIADNIVWEAYIQEHPDSIGFRNKILENFNDLCLISGTVIPEHLVNCGTAGVQFDNSSSELQGRGRDDEFSDHGKKRPSENLSILENGKKLHKISSVEERSSVEEALNGMAGIVTYLAREKEEKQIKRYASTENAIDELQGLSDIDEELLLDACDLLEEEDKAKTFLALDGALRKKWLVRKLRPERS